MADSTLRFRASSRIAYARALLSLVERARNGTDEFTFGPLDLVAVEDQGLTLSGDTILQWADDFLAEVPGLHLADE